MDDPLLVRGFERVGDLFRDRQRFVERNRPTRDPLREVFAFHQFEDQCLDAIGVLDAVDVGDVRMVQRRSL